MIAPKNFLYKEQKLFKKRRGFSDLLYPIHEYMEKERIEQNFENTLKKFWKDQIKQARSQIEIFWGQARNLGKIFFRQYLRL